MEIGLREWLIVIGIIVIAGILFDGWRRMRGGKGKLKFRLDRSLSNLPDDEGSAELLGPPRVLDTHKEPQLDEHDLPSVSMPAREPRESSSSKRGKRGGEPHQATSTWTWIWTVARASAAATMISRLRKASPRATATRTSRKPKKCW